MEIAHDVNANPSVATGHDGCPRPRSPSVTNTSREERPTMKRLWFLLTGVVAVSFAVLGWIGTQIYQKMPPIPDRVVTTDGKTVIASGAIAEGQNVWQTMGGMEVGSAWVCCDNVFSSMENVR